MTKLKEKDIVNHIVSNWDLYFKDISFWRTEYSLRDFRVDIAAYLEAELPKNNELCKLPIFFEVKYNSNMRDLMFELQKQIAFRNWYVNCNKCFCMICVISDEYDQHMVKFMEDNNIEMFKINIENDDLDNMTILEYNSKLYEEEEMQDTCLV